MCRYPGIYVRVRPATVERVRAVRINHAASKGSRRTLKFEAVFSCSLGVIFVRVPTPGPSFVGVTVEVVDPNIPVLIVLDALGHSGMYFNNVRNLLVHEKAEWGINRPSKHVHIYHRWGSFCSCWLK